MTKLPVQRGGRTKGSRSKIIGEPAEDAIVDIIDLPDAVVLFQQNPDLGLGAIFAQPSQIHLDLG